MQHLIIGHVNGVTIRGMSDIETILVREFPVVVQCAYEDEAILNEIGISTDHQNGGVVAELANEAALDAFCAVRYCEYEARTFGDGEQGTLATSLAWL